MSRTIEDSLFWVPLLEGGGECSGPCRVGNRQGRPGQLSVNLLILINLLKIYLRVVIFLKNTKHAERESCIVLNFITVSRILPRH